MNSVVRAGRDSRGFSMVELLVTVVLAGIIFAAMVPVFATALKKTSVDNMRVTATNLAADRIEKIRTLNYADITDANLNDSTFAGGAFVATFTPGPGGGRVFTTTYVVEPQTKYKRITVTVSWSASASDSTTLKTVVMDPAAITSGSTSTPSAIPSPYSTTGTNYTVMVSVTDDDVDHTQGVKVVRTDSGYNLTMNPAFQVPDATNGLTCSWVGLVGGPDVMYTVTVTFKAPRELDGTTHPTEQKSTVVNLIDDTPIYFDTNPYH